MISCEATYLTRSLDCPCLRRLPQLHALFKQLMPGVGQAELTELRAALDADGDGKVTLQELTAFLKRAASQREPAPASPPLAAAPAPTAPVAPPSVRPTASKFRVALRTAAEAGSATDANIFLTLTGAAGVSLRQDLKGKAGKNLFEVGQTDEFELAHGTYLGDALQVRPFLSSTRSHSAVAPVPSRALAPN